MQGIDLGEQQHILTGIAARERPGGPGAAIGDPAGGSELGDAADHLCPRAAGMIQICCSSCQVISLREKPDKL